MATIVTFTREREQPALNRNGNIITFSENWVLVTSTACSPVEADSLIFALGQTNNYSFPKIGKSSHPSNTALKPISYTISRKDGHATHIYNVSVSYTTNIDDVNKNQDPLDADPTYDYADIDIVKEIDRDPISGEVICASNGEPYFPKVQVRDTLTRITVNRNEKNYNPITAQPYKNKINSRAVRIDGVTYPAHTILLESWTGKSAVDADDNIYYQVQYNLLYDPNEHLIELVDAASGPDVNGTNPQLYEATQGKSWKLDGAGAYMTKAQQQNPTLFFSNEFNVYNEIDFNFLRL